MLIDKDTKLYCSFAKEAGSTGSLFHNTGFQKLNINAVYKSFSVDNIRDAIIAMRTLNIKGAGITMPFKKEVLKYVDYGDTTTAEIDAANTVINNNGVLKARNTDWLAIRDFLKTYERKGCVYILGDGGYGRAARYACYVLGIQHKTITRSNWDEIPYLTHCTVFNCTPVEDIKNKLHNSVKFIDCIVSTETGKELAASQAGYQFKLYTGMDYPC